MGVVRLEHSRRTAELEATDEQIEAVARMLELPTSLLSQLDALLIEFGHWSNEEHDRSAVS